MGILMINKCYPYNNIRRSLFYPYTFNQTGGMDEKPLLLTEKDIDRIIEMAWEDRTPFEAIALQFGVPEKEVIELMRKYSKPSSFRMWRKRMNGRSSKHAAFRNGTISRFKCSRQRIIAMNKISKRTK